MTNKYALFFPFLLVFLSAQIKAQNIFNPNSYDLWPTTNSTSGPFAQVPVSPGVTFSQMTRGAGLLAGGSTRGSQSRFGVYATDVAAETAGAYLTFTATSDVNTTFTISAAQISVYRSSAAAPTSFKLQYRIGSGAYTDFVNSSSSPVIDISGLAAGGTAAYSIAPPSPIVVPASTQLEFRFIAWGGTSTTASFAVCNGTSISGTSASATSCPAVTGYSASGLTTSGATISWGGVSGASGYEYVLDQVNADPSVAGTAITNPNYTAMGLDPNTTYYLHTRSNCGGGTYSTWSTTSFTTLCPPPANVVAQRTYTASAFSATCTWDAAQGAASYGCVFDQVSTSPANSSVTATNTYISTASSTTSTYFHVRTNCNGGATSSFINVPITEPLPLTLVSFKAEVGANNKAVLNWITANEINISRFEIERSEDGVSFINVGSVMSKGNQAQTTYQYADEVVANNTYYRLKIWNTDASFQYSNTVKVSGNANRSGDISVYPNPATGDNIIIKTGSNNFTNATIKITNLLGKTLSVQTLNAANEASVNISQLQAGIYLLRYQDNNGSREIRFVKQ